MVPVDPFDALQVFLLVQKLGQKLPEMDRVLVVRRQGQTVLLGEFAR